MNQLIIGYDKDKNMKEIIATEVAVPFTHLKEIVFVLSILFGLIVIFSLCRVLFWKSLQWSEFLLLVLFGVGIVSFPFIMKFFHDIIEKLSVRDIHFAKGKIWAERRDRVLFEINLDDIVTVVYCSFFLGNTPMCKMYLHTEEGYEDHPVIDSRRSYSLMLDVVDVKKIEQVIGKEIIIKSLNG